MLSNWIEWFILLALGSLVLIIFGWAIFAFWSAIFQFVFSWGDPEKIKKAWMSIRYMILGIIMTIAFLFIFPVIFQRINLPNAELFTAQNIFFQAWEIVNFLLGFGKESMRIYNNGQAPSWWWSIYTAPTVSPSNYEL